MTALPECEPAAGGRRAGSKAAILLGSALIVSALSACNYVPASRWYTAENVTPVTAITVLPNQSIHDVARQENVSVEALAYENGLAAPYQLYVGQRLRLPSRPHTMVAGMPASGVGGAPISSGPISAGTVATETIAMPPVGQAGAHAAGQTPAHTAQTASVAQTAPVAQAAPVGQPGQPGQPGLYGTVEAAELPPVAQPSTVSTGSPAILTNQDWVEPASAGGASAGGPPPVGATEVLAPRAQGQQVASLPTPGVSDVPVDDGLTQIAVPAPRPPSPQRTVAEPQAAPPVEQPVVAPVPEPVPEAVPVPDLPPDVEVAAAPQPAPPVPDETVEALAEPASVAELPPIEERGFFWPLSGEIISTFGAGAGEAANDGINIRTTQGTEIQAAQDGFVVYAGNELPGFGNLILVRHAGNWVTAYAHADQMLVDKDQFVRAGQVIATVGQTGSVNEPQLHFEIRQGTKAVDPSLHLPEMPL